MKKLYILISTMLIMFGGNAWAGDDGFYSVDDVRVDGSSWSSGEEFNLDQTYSVEVDLSFTASDLGIAEYEDSQSLVMIINDIEVWSASSPAPDSKVMSGPQVDSAQWSMSGDLLYPGPIVKGFLDPYYLASIHRNGNEIPVTVNKVKVTSDVPEPATMLMFGTGLLGLAAVRRRKMKT